MFFISYAKVANRKYLVVHLAIVMAVVSLDGVSAEVVPDQKSVVPAGGKALSVESVHRDDVGIYTLESIEVNASSLDDIAPFSTNIDTHDMAAHRSISTDTTRLLEDTPGVSVFGAGAISGLPVIHGLADDRLRILVDDMDLMPACPNHMNSILSYIAPSKVGSIKVFAGITPVSAGGDSIGGTIQVKSMPPEFAKDSDSLLLKGQIGTFYRSNSDAHGHNLSASVATQYMNVSYAESTIDAHNYRAARSFKPTSQAGAMLFSSTGMGRWIDGDEVGSSAIHGSKNREIGLALGYEDHLLQLNVSEQKVGFEGFPNQRMDMTANTNTLYNLRYTGQYQWGQLEAHLYDQDTRHKMDMGVDRFNYGFGMPMDTQAKTRGAAINASIDLSDRHMLRIGSDYQTYRLDDWWPPVGVTGMMAPNTFWNVKDGQRDRVGLFGEWEARWSPEWLSLLGVRVDTVKANAGAVQGYNNLTGIWKLDAKAFNARTHEHEDHHLDLTALTRFNPDSTQTYEIGIAQKTRSPNLYERYPWSSNAMAALMNNFVGDGNGYIGNENLKPEVAHTISASADWHDASQQVWGFKVNVYLTHVDDYIDAKRCNFGQCGATNVTKKTGFVLLQYVNQSAKLYGMDVSGKRYLGSNDSLGSFNATGMVSYVRGENLTTGNNLYQIMPLNAKLALVHKLGTWTNTAEVLLVSAKTHVSQVRNEMQTDGYSLFNLRSSYEWQHARLDFSVENVFNRFYNMPLGGAYVGQGWSMSTNTIAWGLPVPGMGRSVNVAMNINF